MLATPLGGALVVAGCAAPALRLSERETEAIVAGIEQRVAADRAAAHEVLAKGADARVPADIDVPAVVSLGDALRIAAAHNRDLRTRRESVTLSAVALRNARHDTGARLAGSVASVVSGGDGREMLRDESAALSLTDLLPTGGEATLAGDVSRQHGLSDRADSSADGSLVARLRQPLLRGAGYESSHEQLTDAERQALYDVRDYDLARQDLALRVQRDYYALVSQHQVIRNRELSLESFEFLKRRSEALFQVGRVSEVDKFRATREYLTAENNLIDARQEFEARLDRFKILLGLDTGVAFDIADEIPAPAELALPLERAIAVALASRLDLMSARDQVDDAERHVRVRERNMLPDLGVEAVRTWRSDPARGVGDLGRDDASYTLGVSLELPLDRVRERGELRRAQIELDRARRGLALAEEQVISDVRDSLRSLRSAENSYSIQERIVASEEKNAKVARLRFEQGEIGNRDLTDALIARADAQDRLVRERANVATARQQLLRDAGLMLMEEDGTWQDFVQPQR